MKKIKKRGAVYGVIALLLCAAAYLNWSYVDTPEDLLAAQQTDAQADTQTDASADSTAGEGDYFGILTADAHAGERRAGEHAQGAQ